MIQEVAAGTSLTKDFFQFLNFLRGVVGADVISSYHRYDGTKVEGTEKIEIELIKMRRRRCFFYRNASR